MPRPFPSSLGALVGWLWRQLASPETAFRTKCAEVFFSFAQLLPVGQGQGSRALACRAWIKAEAAAAASGGGGSAADGSGRGAVPAFVALAFEAPVWSQPGASAHLGASAARGGAAGSRATLRALCAALDAYGWCLAKGILTPAALLFVNLPLAGGANGKKRKAAAPAGQAPPPPVDSGGP